MTVHRAGIFQELIDFFEGIIDILEGREPSSDPKDPNEDPEDPVLDEEECDEVNEAVDTADDEGVEDVPEARVDTSWTYEEVYDFVSLMIWLIENHVSGGHGSGH